MQDIDVNKQSTVGHQCPISERVGLAMNLPPARYHTKANTELEEEKKRTYSFSISWRYIKYCTRKTVYEKELFFSVILSSERSQVYTFVQFT